VKEKKKRARKRKDVEKNTVRYDDDFDLFKDLPSLNETQNLNKRAKVDETINKIIENAGKKSH
jgi:hypothetical protein